MGRKPKVRVAAAATVATVAAAAGLIAVAGSPDAAAPRVTIYSYSKFNGLVSTLYTWDDDLGNNTWRDGSRMNNSISSIKNTTNYRMCFYPGYHFGTKIPNGTNHVLQMMPGTELRFLGDMDNTISSLRPC
jgi:hypothetical protein